MSRVSATPWYQTLEAQSLWCCAKPASRCVGPKCMAWIWLHAAHNTREEGPSDRAVGRCGLVQPPSESTPP